jgi:hypothetical protein
LVNIDVTFSRSSSSEQSLCSLPEAFVNVVDSEYEPDAKPLEKKKPKPKAKASPKKKAEPTKKSKTAAGKTKTAGKSIGDQKAKKPVVKSASVEPKKTVAGEKKESAAGTKGESAQGSFEVRRTGSGGEGGYTVIFR